MERKAKHCLLREETVATIDNRPGLLKWEDVFERRRLVSKVNAGFCEDRRYPIWVSGGRMNSKKENIRRYVELGGKAVYRTKTNRLCTRGGSLEFV